jgi:ribosome-binding factor A
MLVGGSDMAKQRAQRVGEEIKKEVSEILHLELNDPGLKKMTSVTGVEVTRDLSYATIYVSIFVNKEEQKKVLEALGRATGFVRLEIGKRIRLRHVPEIEFKLDHSMEYGAHIENVLRGLHSKPGINNGADDNE